MSASGKTIAKNVGVMMTSQLITWSLSLVIAIFLPRYLGAEAIGQFSIANAIWAIMSMLIVFGMDLHLTKSIARDPSRTATLLGTTLVLRSLFFVVGSGVAFLYLNLLNYDREVVIVTFIVGLSFLPGVFSSASGAALAGLERMEYISLATIVSKVVSTGLTLLMIFFGYGIYPIAAVMIISPIASLMVQLIYFVRNGPLRLHFSLSEGKAMLRASAPYLLTSMSLVVYQQMDKLFISSMVDTRTVGWYGTATNLFGTFMFIPVVLTTALFPALARSYTNAKDQMQIIARRSLDLMFILSIPVGLGLMVIAEPLVQMIYGPEFAPSGTVLSLLGIVLIFTYLNILTGQMLISTDRTGQWNVVMIIAIVLTLPLDLVLVPWAHETFGNGALGGVLSFMITECAMVISAILLLPKGTLQWGNVRTAALSLVSGLIMVGVCSWLRDSFILIMIAAGAVTYITAVLALRVVSREDQDLIKGLLQQMLRRLRRSSEVPAGIGH